MTGSDTQPSPDFYDLPAEPEADPQEPEVDPQEPEVDPQEEIAEPEESTEDPVAQLNVELEAAKAESEEWRDRFLRKAAELENFRKRTEKEKPETVTRAKSSILLEVLPIMDACERALESFEDEEADQDRLGQYREGVELLYKQLSNTLNRLGVVPVEARGEEFDPHLHEALSREETSEFEENVVTKELRRGYLYQDRLLRPSQVIVAIRPQELEVTES
jgi:molecular chaperone GrpE